MECQTKVVDPGNEDRVRIFNVAWAVVLAFYLGTIACGSLGSQVMLWGMSGSLALLLILHVRVCGACNWAVSTIAGAVLYLALLVLYLLIGGSPASLASATAALMAFGITAAAVSFTNC